jgi:2-polyprenyl-6-methoxyphenol hydroxylase-like FAD-dependent oxidoreductase
MSGLFDFDVVIVGGRPAGASLAARLGRRGLRVLLVDRASFPSLPAVPSSPSLHPGAMRILDELGIEESRYAASGAPMHSMIVEFRDYFHSQMRVPKLWGRDYVYGLDRQRFDYALWEFLAQFPSVTRRDGYVVSDLLRDGTGRVIGIIGGARGEAPSEIRADCVVGADGRFSLVARRAGAQVLREDRVHVSTVHYADWEGVADPYGDRTCAYIYASTRGLDVPMFRMPGGRMSVNLHVRADRVEVGGDVQRYYENTLKSLPQVWRLLSSARQVNHVVGIKRIGNGYRQASGPGWVLVGDALHYKDPVDGQGIYDALLEARLLDQAIAVYRSGRSFDEAMADYSRAVDAATGTMFEQTTARLRRELYQDLPAVMIKTFLRWLITDPGYQQRFMLYFTRSLPDDRLMTPELVAGSLLRGMGRDLRALLPRVLAR